MKILSSKSIAQLCLAVALQLSCCVTAQASQITFFVNDLTGSPVAAINDDGQVIWRENFKPYGERMLNQADAAENNIWFAARHQDADTGLTYMGARYYDPRIGRFLSTDPVRFSEGNVHSFNRYAYANNNPHRFVDPDGKDSITLSGEKSTEAAADADDAVAAQNRINYQRPTLDPGPDTLVRRQDGTIVAIHPDGSKTTYERRPNPKYDESTDPTAFRKRNHIFEPSPNDDSLVRSAISGVMGIFRPSLEDRLEAARKRPAQTSSRRG